VKENHVISFHAIQSEVHGQPHTEFSIMLNVICSQGLVRQHPIDLNVDADVEPHPFRDCTFTYPEPPGSPLLVE
jgi:hypothetical protein